MSEAQKRRAEADARARWQNELVDNGERRGSEAEMDKTQHSRASRTSVKVYFWFSSSCLTIFHGYALGSQTRTHFISVLRLDSLDVNGW